MSDGVLDDPGDCFFDGSSHLNSPVITQMGLGNMVVSAGINCNGNII